jgi:hypothetical protein
VHTLFTTVPFDSKVKYTSEVPRPQGWGFRVRWFPLYCAPSWLPAGRDPTLPAKAGPGADAGQQDKIKEGEKDAAGKSYFLCPSTQ